jgi:hypothetical protein
MRDSIIRALAIVAGIGVVSASTHLNILHAGGYGAPDTPLMIAVAGMVVIGMAFAGLVWSDGRKASAIVVTVCLLAGEAYWTLANAEREIANRVVAAAPSTEARNARKDAENRLSRAITAKQAADTSILADAAKADCASNCRALLLSAQQAANSEWLAASAALLGVPNVLSPTPLADHIGIAAWLWDLIVAGLRSVGVLGGSLMIGMATVTRKKAAPPKLELVASKPQPAPVPQISPVESKRPAPHPIPPPAPASNPRANVVPLTAKRQLPEGMVSDFASRRLSKSLGSEADMKSCYLAYQKWCEEQNKQPVPAPRFIPSFLAYCEATGVKMRDEGEVVYCVDVKLWAS